MVQTNTALIIQENKMINNDNFYKLYSILNKKTKSGIEIKFKNESAFMKLLGKLLFFNKSFMTKYTTTIGNTIYFPNKEYVDNTDSDESITILSHEFVHIRDNERFGILFNLAYLSPQIFSLLALLIVPFSLYGLLFLLLLLPIPSYGRMVIERRAYATNLYSMYRLLNHKKYSPDDISIKQIVLSNFLNKQFVSFSYYLMWPFGVKKHLISVINSINSGEFEKTNDIYKDLSEAYDELFTGVLNE